MSFTSMVQRHEQLQQALSNTEITSINWVRLICEYCDSIMDVNKQESLKSIFEELKQHILWVYPFICHLDKERYQSIFCHTFDVLRYAMKTRDEQLYAVSYTHLDVYKRQGCTFIFDYFHGECSKHEIERLRGVMKKNTCNLVIGIGGGKIFDTCLLYTSFSSFFIIAE